MGLSQLLEKIMNYILDLHTHTIASTHAYSTFQELVAVAKLKDLKVFGFSDHAPSLGDAPHIFHFQNLKVIPDVIDGIRILKGVEANIIDYSGRIDMGKEDLHCVDYVIASLHPPCIVPSSKEDNTNAMIGAIKNPVVNILGHPDDSRYEVDYAKVIAAAKEHNVFIEMNNASMNPKGFRKGAKESYIEILGLCIKYDVKIILGSDAHISYDVANFDYCQPLLDELDFPERLIVNNDVEKLLQVIKFEI